MTSMNIIIIDTWYEEKMKGDKELAPTPLVV